jgi:hypothetical protein
MVIWLFMRKDCVFVGITDQLDPVPGLWDVWLPHIRSVRSEESEHGMPVFFTQKCQVLMEERSTVADGA